ncbi:MAG: hypothetical protein MR579_03995, partial [Bacteroidales bacterium]|nr:hypothetical protein [Bacteroidales bacterium]
KILFLGKSLGREGKNGGERGKEPGPETRKNPSKPCKERTNFRRGMDKAPPRDYTDSGFFRF